MQTFLLINFVAVAFSDPVCDLYEATNIGFYSTGWNCSGSTPLSPVCKNATASSWSNIQCYNGLVIQISFSNVESITGTIPTTIGLLDSLKYLGFNNNLLSGSIPTSVGLISSLIGLYLTNNNFGGTLPTQLGLLPNLQFLYAEQNSLTGTIPTTLGNIQSLKAITLNSNQLSGSLPESLCYSGAVIQRFLVAQNSGLTCYPSCLSTIAYRVFPSKTLRACSPTGQPSGQPTAQPSSRPSSQPSARPSAQPSAQPSSRPSSQPS